MYKKTFSPLLAGAAVVGAVAVVAAGTAVAHGSNSDAAPELTAFTEDLFKPGAEMMFQATCWEDRAQLTTSFGAEAVMSPAADSANLIGFITAPVNIGPGPDGGVHTFTVTCGEQSFTGHFNNDTNGTHN